jgi:hypothetical protein
MTTYTSQPDETDGIDTQVNSFAPTTNYGTGTDFRVGNETNVDNPTFRGLLKFDFSKGTNPPTRGATVSSATLYLTQTGEDSVNNRTLRVYRLKRAWVEAQATWNVYSTGNNWSTAGGFHADDCEQTDIGSKALSSTEANGEKTITLTAAAVQEMIWGDFANNGFLLKMDTEADDRYTFGAAGHATATSRPKLVVEYILGGQVIIWESE